MDAKVYDAMRPIADSRQSKRAKWKYPTPSVSDLPPTLNRSWHLAWRLHPKPDNSCMLHLLTHPSIDARRYFKQSEIALYRQAPEIAATPQIAQQQQIQQQVLLQQQQQQQALPPGSATAGPGREATSTYQQNNQPVSAPAA